MRLKSVSFQNVPVMENRSIEISENIFIFYGDNASGKTVALTSIHSVLYETLNSLYGPYMGNKYAFKEFLEPSELESSVSLLGEHEGIPFEAILKLEGPNKKFYIRCESDQQHEDLHRTAGRLPYLGFYQQPSFLMKRDFLVDFYLWYRVGGNSLVTRLSEAFTKLFPDTDLGLLPYEPRDYLPALDSLSNGQIRVLYLLWDLLSRTHLKVQEGGIVFIDDLETYLSPKNQKKIVPVLTETFPNTQFIVSSSSFDIVKGQKVWNHFNLDLE